MLLCDLLQAKQSELENLQASLASDASKLTEQLSSFEARREAAIRELQVGSLAQQVWAVVLTAVMQ